MTIHHYPDIPEHLHRSVLTMGSFDGVHYGHRLILDRVVQSAREMDAAAVLVTFDTHPRKVLNKEMGGNGLLTTPEERQKIFSSIGIDHLVCMHFNEELAAIEPEDFVQEVFVNRLKAAHVITGYGHRFGKGGRGDHTLLEELSALHGFTTHMIPMQQMEDIMISSTRIRHLLSSGEVNEASRYLGYSYPLTGTVVPGNRLGREIGFPTANIMPDHPAKLIPGDGVYAIRCSLEGSEYNGMLNIGVKPTLPGQPRTIEAHLFELNLNLYEKKITITFEHRIRDEQRFGSLEALREQLILDKATAITMLDR